MAQHAHQGTSSLRPPSAWHQKQGSESEVSGRSTPRVGRWVQRPIERRRLHKVSQHTRLLAWKVAPSKATPQSHRIQGPIAVAAGTTTSAAGRFAHGRERKTVACHSSPQNTVHCCLKRARILDNLKGSKGPEKQQKARITGQP